MSLLQHSNEMCDMKVSGLGILHWYRDVVYMLGSRYEQCSDERCKMQMEGTLGL